MHLQVLLYSVLLANVRTEWYSARTASNLTCVILTRIQTASSTIFPGAEAEVGDGRDGLFNALGQGRIYFYLNPACYKSISSSLMWQELSENIIVCPRKCNWPFFLARKNVISQGDGLHDWKASMILNSSWGLWSAESDHAEQQATGMQIICNAKSGARRWPPLFIWCQHAVQSQRTLFYLRGPSSAFN